VRRREEQEDVSQAHLGCPETETPTPTSSTPPNAKLAAWYQGAFFLFFSQINQGLSIKVLSIKRFLQIWPSGHGPFLVHSGPFRSILVHSCPFGPF
jgi:hypothetical protein